MARRNADLAVEQRQGDELRRLVVNGPLGSDDDALDMASGLGIRD